MHAAGAGSSSWEVASNRTGDHHFAWLWKKRLFRCFFLVLFAGAFEIPTAATVWETTCWAGISRQDTHGTGLAQRCLNPHSSPLTGTGRTYMLGFTCLAKFWRGSPFPKLCLPWLKGIHKPETMEKQRRGCCRNKPTFSPHLAWM